MSRVCISMGMIKPLEQIPQLKRLNLSVTKFCNLHCRMCDYPKFSQFEKQLSCEQIKLVIRESAALGAKILELSGGEPMVRKEIYEIIAYARSFGLEVLIVTNGVLMRQSEVRKLIEAGLTSVSFSMEGPEPIHDYIRGQGNYQKTLSAIRCFLSYQPEVANLNIIVGITLSRYNYQAILSFSKFLSEETGVHQVTLNPFSGEMLVRKNRKSREDEFNIPPELISDLTRQIDQLIAYAKSVPDKMPAPGYLAKIPDYFEGKRLIPNGGCQIPLTFCGISANGWVSACLKNPPLGNLKEKSLTEILQSEKFQRFSQLALAGKCNGCLTACYAEIYS